MKRGEIVQGKVIKVSFPNKGIIETAEGDRLRVKGVLPGQTVSVRVKKSSKEKAQGNLLSVDAKSELEMDTPSCVHFGKCGGCTYQSLPYDKQLGIKEGMIHDLMAPVIGEDVWNDTYEGIKASPNQFAYRNKMEFSFGDEVKDGPLTLGMHKKGSFYDVVTVDGCQIIDADMRQVLTITLEYFAKSGQPYYRKNTHEGYLRHLLVRKAAKTGEILVDLVTSTQISSLYEIALLAGWKDTLLAAEWDGKITGILHTKNDREADVVADEGTEILYGQSWFKEEILGLSFTITPFSFFQTNSLGAEVLYSTARDFIAAGADGAEVYDLYSGTGTIAQVIAPAAKHVTGVEIIAEAVEAAKDNAKLNGLDNCDFIAGDVLKVLDDISEKPDYIILDPPRDGIHPKALEKIIDYGVDSLVYISCKPTSLARDLEVFLARGYKVTRLACVDMFPGTYHVETVVLLSQQKPDDHIEIEINLDELDATSAETKATYMKIQNWVQEKYGFHVTNLNIAQVKQKHGIIERENYNKPKSENSRQPGCPEEKVKAIEDALRHFQMI
ncbi:23S rRNA (uracil(1939)-C(5))-methyltransferase RlmD [Pseudobutyrivibrio sp.]|uniref:23S rRNA (uracil(1939)-C(5))-methyltransferase RlmD n=1 Tax=Pseudobutyrivibrio sp. TaxID=2014367 RepID=UPI001DF2FB8E|nr:23S rRNA (uracil(1939)-C(5))-methyltransferase RlmD [Pseudobutyrivibrio sp.]MBE5912306.1 23S rRNA (uracil(1939)-C(5))-methyltransferase RlmD [Pseudobutyrivibrio sp.]